jgi:hypothetical protein
MEFKEGYDGLDKFVKQAIDRTKGAMQNFGYDWIVVGGMAVHLQIINKIYESIKIDNEIKSIEDVVEKAIKNLVRTTGILRKTDDLDIVVRADYDKLKCDLVAYYNQTRGLSFKGFEEAGIRKAIKYTIPKEMQRDRREPLVVTYNASYDLDINDTDVLNMPELGISEVRIPKVEYLVALKLYQGRPKDLMDVNCLLRYYIKDFDEEYFEKCLEKVSGGKEYENAIEKYKEIKKEITKVY